MGSSLGDQAEARESKNEMREKSGAQSVAVGMAPWYAIQAAFFIGAFLLLLLAVRTLRYGPTVIVSGIKDPVMLPVYKASTDYADAISRRFIREYWTWSYTGQMMAKRRAGYLSTDECARQVLGDGLSKNDYYRKLLLTCQVSITQLSVSPGPDDSYRITFAMTLKEWVSYLATSTAYEGTVTVVPSTDSSKDVPLLVESYEFKPVARAQMVEETADASDMARLFTEAEALHAAERGTPKFARTNMLLADEAVFFGLNPSTDITPQTLANPGK